MNKIAKNTLTNAGLLLLTGLLIYASWDLLWPKAYADNPHSTQTFQTYETINQVDSQAIAFAQAGANNNISAWTLKPQWSFAGGSVNSETAFSLMIGQKACKDCLLFSGSFAFDSEETAVGFGASGTF